MEVPVSYEEKRGNLFNSKAEALVNTVNCEGFMGKGIALEFRRRFPAMFAAYKADCAEGRLKPGSFYDAGTYPGPFGLVQILNFAIKDRWRNPSQKEWITSTLQQFLNGYFRRGLSSVAFPWMGAANGGIDLEWIQNAMRQHLQSLPEDAVIEVYTFDADASDPLFEELKWLALAGEAQIDRVQKNLKIQKHRFDAAISAVRNGECRSLARLAESKLLGDVSLDKLYAYLAERAAKSAAPPRPEPTGPAQQLRLL